MTSPAPDTTEPRPVILLAQQLGFAHPGAPLFDDLCFELRSGLTWVRGGDGRGKTTLLQLLAGNLQPTAGRVQRLADTLWWEQPADAAHDGVVARAWLAQRRARFPAWHDALATDLVAGFGLVEHLDKPMYMLSTGSRRKVGLVGAAASGADLTLIDSPCAALDARSCRLVMELLGEAVEDRQRAWVVADHELPQELAPGALAALIDLGD
jgi:ABC-type transport system involved in cytochrome c biogenesis ATPase subunit